jgi:hypothetical protein
MAKTQSKRCRPVSVTLTPQGRLMLEALAETRRSRSAAVEEAVAFLHKQDRRTRGARRERVRRNPPLRDV